MNMEIADYSVYGNEIDVMSDALIRAGAERLGFRVALVELAKNMASHDHFPFVWLRYDLRCREDLDFVHGLAASLEKKGHHVFPSSQSVVLAEDKWETFSALRYAGIATVDSFRLDNLPPGDRPVVIKPRIGWGGRGIRLIENMEDIPGENRDLYIVQPCIAHDRTFTVAAAGGLVIAALRTDSQGSEFIFNCSEGAPPVLVECQPDMASMAAQALEALGLAAGSVDIIESGGSCLVLEVNSAPRLYYEALAGLDLAGPMAKSVAAWWRNHQ